MYDGRSRTSYSSHGVAQPRYSKSRVITPAVNPHRITSRSGPIRKAGPTQPDGCRTPMRWSGRSSSDTGTRWIACTSSGSTTRTGDGVSHQPSTGVTAKLLGGR